MIISYKDTFKMLGILIVSFCAVFVCALFLNYYIDLINIETMITTDTSRIFYEAQCNTSKVVSAVSGGCLLLTSIVLVCFYIGHFIDTHTQQIGILKALGYSKYTIAKKFGIFGLPIFTGTSLGFFCAHLLMPKFYEVQNKDGYLPHFEATFHLGLCIALIGMPTVFFTLLAVIYSRHRLKTSALELIRGTMAFKNYSYKKIKSNKSKKASDLPFLLELKKSNVRQRKSLVFFITFSVFCFSSMMQMSFSMEELASRMMTIMTTSIGIVLASVTLLIATTSVIKANSKTITMMKAFGYDTKACSKAVLGGYRPWAYFGFVLGSIYQFALLKIAVTIIFADMEGVPEYKFNWSALSITLAAFLLLYETIMFIYTNKIKKFSIKEIMLE